MLRTVCSLCPSGLLMLAALATVGCGRFRPTAQTPPPQQSDNEQWLVESQAAEKTPRLTLAYAGMLESQRQFDVARSQYQSVIARGGQPKGDQPAATPKEVTAARIGLARLNGQQGLDAEAVAAFDQLVSTQPGNAEALRSYGQYQLSKRRMPEAEGLLRRAVAADPRDSDAKRALAAVLVRTGRHDEARPIYVSLSGETEGRTALAKALLSSGNPVAAQQELQTLLATDPGNRTIAAQLAQLNRHLQQTAALRQVGYERQMGAARPPAAAPKRFASNADAAQPLPPQRITTGGVTSAPAPVERPRWKPAR